MRRAAAAVVLILALPAAAAPPADAPRQLAARQAEVAELQQRVARQEAQGMAAEKQLQAKDRTIAELKRQLESARGPATAGGR